jgi:uncharacterized protein (DUF2141 family)
MRVAIILSISLLLFARVVYSQDYTLTVNVTGIKSDKGDIYVELYSEQASFRKSNEALERIKVSASIDPIRVKFNTIPSGHYALIAYHDEDANGSLNRRFGMIPTEGYALSNNPEIRIGPPAFKDCEFEFVGDDEKTLKLHY